LETYHKDAKSAKIAEIYWGFFFTAETQRTLSFMGMRGLASWASLGCARLGETDRVRPFGG